MRKIALAVSIVVALSACGGGNSDPGFELAARTRALPTLVDVPVELSAGMNIGKSTWVDGVSSTSAQNAPIDGVNCSSSKAYQFRSHVAIFHNGQALAIPSNVGMQGCTYELRTIDHSGIVYVEAAAQKRFTLGQFFSVWGQAFESGNVADIKGMPMRVFVNDGHGLMLYQGVLRELEFLPHREITIELGTPIQEMPTYEWTHGL